MKKRILLMLLFLGILGSSIWIAINSAAIQASVLEKGIVIEGQKFTPSMEAHNFDKAGLRALTYQVAIPIDDFDASVGHYEILIFRLADNAHRVIFNDKVLGLTGDFETGNSNLWNGLFSYALDTRELETSNTLTIETRAIYRTGLSVAPIIILPYEEALALKGKLYFFGEQINNLMVGFIFFSSIITLLFYFINGRKSFTFFLITLATFFTGIYYSNYLTLVTVGMPYLVYKKLVMTSMFLCIASYTYVIARYFKQRWLYYLAHITVIIGIVIAVISRDMVFYKMLYTYGYALVLINLIAWIFVTLKHLKSSTIAYIFFLSFVTLILYGGTTVFMDMSGSYFNFNSPVVYISVLSFLPLLLIYEAFKEKEILLINEKTLKEQEITNAMTDPLTGVWNQRYIKRLFNEDIGHYVMTVMDIDNFKQINDTYGHLAGDYVLRTLAQILKDHLRKTDVICRYGGDEFIILKYDCKLKEGLKVMENIRSYIEAYDFNYEDQAIKVTISAGMGESKGEKTVESVFNDIDVLLYQAKTAGKNTLVFESI